MFIEKYCRKFILLSIICFSNTNSYASIHHIFPELHTGHIKFPSYVSFLREEWKKPVYDAAPDSIFSNRFAELVPFGHDVKNYINNHNDTFTPNMRMIKKTIINDLDKIMKSNAISSNDIFLTLFRFQAAISTIEQFPNQTCTLIEVAQDFIQGLIRTWESAKLSRKLFDNFQMNYNNYIIDKIFGLGGCDEVRYKIYLKLIRKLPLKILVPILGESHLGIRFLLDNLLDDIGLVSFYSSKQFINADGRKDTPLQFSVHDVLHTLVLTPHRIPIHPLISILQTPNNRHHSIDEDKISQIIEQSAQSFHIKNNYFKDFLKFIDLRYINDMNLSDEINLESEYIKISIGIFLHFHEIIPAICTSFMNRESIYTLSRDIEYHLCTDLNIKDYYNQKLNDAYFTVLLLKEYENNVRVRRQNGCIILERHTRRLCCFGAKIDPTPQIIAVYYSFEFLHNKLKGLEGLLHMIPNYRNFEQSGSNIMEMLDITINDPYYEQHHNEWAYIRNNIIECINGYTHALIQFNDAPVSIVENTQKNQSYLDNYTKKLLEIQMNIQNIINILN